MRGVSMPDWRIYTGDADPHEAVLPPAPPWRRFGPEPSAGSDDAPDPASLDSDAAQAGSPEGDESAPGVTFQATPEMVEAVNAAIVLRRPLLLTGRPGSGKSSLIESVARELHLGPVLRWHVTSSSTLTDALYRYDAIGRLHMHGLRSAPARVTAPHLRRGAGGSAHRGLPPAGASGDSAAAASAATRPAHRRDRQERHRPSQRPAQ